MSDGTRAMILVGNSSVSVTVFRSGETEMYMYRVVVETRFLHGIMIVNHPALLHARWRMKS